MTSSSKNAAKSSLPLHVLAAINNATQYERALNAENELRPKPGPKPMPPERIHHAVLIADSDRELDELTRMFQCAVGGKSKGNKRLGRKHIYAALILDFYVLKKLGIKLPRNKYLSRHATMHGLARTIVDFSLAPCDVEMIMSPKANGVETRRKLARDHARLFSRVANAIDGKINPLQRS